MKKHFRIISMLFISIVLTSCVITSELSDTSGHTEFSSSSFLQDLIEDLSCWIDGNSEQSAVDRAVISVKDNLLYTGAASQVYMEKQAEDYYEMDFSFSNLNQLVNRLTLDPNQTIVRISEQNGKKRLEINLNLENYSNLSKVVPLLADPNIEVYGPLYNNPPYESRTEEEYLFMIDFIFGSGSESIKASSINLNYTAPSMITATNGKANGNTASFSFPLIDFILLHEPIYLYCEWQSTDK